MRKTERFLCKIGYKIRMFIFSLQLNILWETLARAIREKKKTNKPKLEKKENCTHMYNEVEV